jgi:elongation factor Ts
MDQKFVKNPDLSIAKLLKEYEAKVGGKITIANFHKLNLGEGIEKKEDNLAEEVAKMTQA